jgi:hypothetical protein
MATLIARPIAFFIIGWCPPRRRGFVDCGGDFVDWGQEDWTEFAKPPTWGAAKLRSERGFSKTASGLSGT